MLEDGLGWLRRRIVRFDGVQDVEDINGMLQCVIEFET
tara:strand:- start:453 stop:566 length:114 start_codon:yes stop_codon:yes gene_type:complete